MTIIIKVITWFLVGLAMLGVFGSPFLIGRQRKMDAWDCVISIVKMTLMLIVAGRVMGWI